MIAFDHRRWLKNNTSSGLIKIPVFSGAHSELTETAAFCDIELQIERAKAEQTRCVDKHAAAGAFVNNHPRIFSWLHVNYLFAHD